MKLSPELLRSIAVGIGLSVTLPSCGINEVDATPKAHDQECTKTACTKTCQKAAQQAYIPYNCPGCGMG